MRLDERTRANAHSSGRTDSSATSPLSASVAGGHRNQTADPFGPQRCHETGRTSTPVETCHDRAVETERVEQLTKIMGESGLLAGSRRIRVAEAGRTVTAEIRHHDICAGSGQPCHDLVVTSHVVWKAVEQHHLPPRATHESDRAGPRRARRLIALQLYALLGASTSSGFPRSAEASNRQGKPVKACRVTKDGSDTRRLRRGRGTFGRVAAWSVCSVKSRKALLGMRKRHTVSECWKRTVRNGVWT